MANLKAMDSDWFGQTYMGRKSKVKAKIFFRMHLTMRCHLSQQVVTLRLTYLRSDVTTASTEHKLLYCVTHVGGDSSHGEVQPVGGLSVSGSPIRRHRLQVGHHSSSPAAEGGRTVWSGGSLRSWRTGGPIKFLHRT